MSYSGKPWLSERMWGCDDRLLAYEDSRAVAVPSADITQPRTTTTSVAFKDCRLCGLPTMPKWDICQTCFDGMRERAAREEEIVKYG